MDYSKLTKQELLQLVTEQQALKDAVEAKDVEMVKVIKEKEEMKRKLFEASHALKDIEIRDSKIQELQNEINHLNDYYKKQIQQQEVLIKEQAEKIVKERNIDEVLKQNELLRADANFAVDVANKYINTFRNYLKFQQGALDNMIEMEALLTKQIQTKEV